jgi:arabinose-5-phosphate isomerase
VAREVIEIEAAAVRGLIPHLDEAFDAAVELIAGCTGRVICTGMGKSGLVMKKVAATLSSTGTPAFFLHPAEAAHGDVGMVIEGDVVLAASFSGTTEELQRLVQILKRIDVPLVMMTGRPDSTLAKLADLHLPVPIDKEACPLDLAPTASTTATLAMGDALAMALLEAKGFTPEDFARLHPSGNLGKKLLRAEDLMHSGDELPRVRTTALMRDTIAEMTRGSLGITAVTDEQGRLVGCITDGDLRRLLQRHGDLLELSAGDCMHPDPSTIDRTELASAALQRMEERRITSIFVCDAQRRLEGLVHLHDLWRLELF